MKFNRDGGQPSMKKIYQNFVKKRWMECAEDGERKLFLYKPSEPTMSRYPVYRPKLKKQKTSDIYQKDYLALLLAEFKAYNSLYRVDELVKLNELNGSDGGAGGTMTADEYEKKMKKIDKQKNNKFKFTEMEQDIQKLEKVCVQIASMDLLYYADTKLIFDDIIVDSSIVLRYRDDIKHYLLLRNLILEYQNEYGDIFDPWQDAIKLRN